MPLSFGNECMIMITCCTSCFCVVRPPILNEASRLCQSGTSEQVLNYLVLYAFQREPPSYPIMSPVVERHPSHFQTPPTTDSHEQSTPYVRALFQTELSQFRAMPQTPTACASVLSAIDKKVIDAARQYTQSLLLRRNSLSPKSALPSELLTRTFPFLALA